MDIRTIIALIIMGDIFTVILIFAYQLQFKKDDSINLFLLGNLIEAIAWSLLGLRKAIPDIISISFGNPILFLSATLKAVAFLMIKGSFTKKMKRAYIVGLLFSIISFDLVAVFFNYDNIRVAVSSSILVMLWILPIYMLNTEKRSSILQRVIAALYSIVMIIIILRAYDGFISGSNIRLFSDDIYNTLSFLSLYIVMLVGNIGFILLAKEKSDRELLSAATYDGLTGILNRKTFQAQAEQAISLFSRKKEPLSLLLMDLDNFKRINDLYGHYSGDIVLKDFAESIKGHLRAYDIFGRFGGEEFIVLLPGANDKEALDTAERLRHIIESNTVISNNEIKYTVSIGIVTLIPDENTTTELLYKYSDDALYRAKENGRNRVEIIRI